MSTECFLIFTVKAQKIATFNTPIFCRQRKCCNLFCHNLSLGHIANTSATLLGGYNADMVRVGLGLYGYGCDGLVPAKTVTTKVIALRNCKSGDKVSYGGYTLQKDCTLAVVNCGYANGFPVR